MVFFGQVVVFADHVEDPGGFAGYVEVVSAVLGAGGDDGGGVEVVGADCV